VKRQLLTPLTAAVAAVVLALLAANDLPVRAQPVATIALPAPGNTQQLYPACNNISLTFPDATPSQTVVQAVTPAGTVETLWRFNGPLNKFEGFSPAYPQASDLMSVNFLDAVWLCMTTGAPPGAVAPPTPVPPTPTPPVQVIPPAPLPSGADITPTDLYPDNQPQGVMWVRITNNGPDALANNKVSITVSESRSTLTVPPVVDSSVGPAIEFTQSLNPGGTVIFKLGSQIDTSHYRYDFTVTVTAVDFTDPNMGNNIYTESVEPIMASLALNNLSGGSIDSVVFRLAGDPSWGNNQLTFAESVNPGQTRTWQIPAGTYDLRAYIGQQVLDERLNVGISGTYDWTVQAALDIHNSASFTIQEVYITLGAAADWGPNLLGPGEAIPPGAVRRFTLEPAAHDLQVRGVLGQSPTLFHRTLLWNWVEGVCAWFIQDQGEPGLQCWK
jgi:hypothetical protein